jgi:hypothetical protein
LLLEVSSGLIARLVLPTGILFHFELILILSLAEQALPTFELALHLRRPL